MSCSICKKTDIVLNENAKNWTCPFCHVEMLLKESTSYNTKHFDQMYLKLNDLANKCTDNMNRLNAMMLEMKGLVAKIRPEVKKTGWYGDEIEVKEDVVYQIEDKI